MASGEAREGYYIYYTIFYIYVYIYTYIKHRGGGGEGGPLTLPLLKPIFQKKGRRKQLFFLQNFNQSTLLLLHVQTRITSPMTPLLTHDVIWGQSLIFTLLTNKTTLTAQPIQQRNKNGSAGFFKNNQTSKNKT